MSHVQGSIQLLYCYWCRATGTMPQIWWGFKAYIKDVGEVKSYHVVQGFFCLRRKEKER